MPSVGNDGSDGWLQMIPRIGHPGDEPRRPHPNTGTVTATIRREEQR